ncbi:delta-like protein A [Ostrea edulis]|uniref:delta-like protein A n=1 Tax=Ostrea edulis TaxID=37623 RepID=UPI0024AFBE78|nr:delta-like protein A [Ostrea edulis]
MHFQQTGILFAIVIIALKLSAYNACSIGVVNGSEKCCTNYIKVDHTCQVCPSGYFGESCSSPCNYPAFGFRCLSNCSCSSTNCNHVTGCVYTTEYPLGRRTKTKSSNDCGNGETSEHGKCCTNYYRTNNVCLECPLGHFGDNCSSTCNYPSFGSKCRENCNCLIDKCDYRYGCRVTERPELWPTTGSTPEYKSTPGTESVQIIVSSESGNSAANIDSSSNNLPIVIVIGSLIVCVIVMIIIHALLKYLRRIFTIQDDTEASVDVYMEISDNMVLGQGGVSNEANVREALEMPVIEQPGPSNNDLAFVVSADEDMADYVYSEVKKKPKHEVTCDNKPIESEKPKMNLVDSHDTYCDVSDIQEMNESDENGYQDTPLVQDVDGGEASRGVAISNE